MFEIDVKQPSNVGHPMKTRGVSKHAFAVPEVTDGMCGTCQFWHAKDGDELGECAVLAISHRRGAMVKRKRPIPDVTGMGPLRRMVALRTMEADDGYEWRQEGGGEVVPAEDFSGTPREFVDLSGERKKIWGPLRTYEWGGCTRWDEEWTVFDVKGEVA